MYDFTARVIQEFRLPLGSRNHSGFTLVEVLVVSLIVATLAAVAIPVYSGFIKTQRIEVVNDLAQTVSVAANIYYRRNGTVPPSVAALNLFYDAAKFTIVVADPEVTVTDKTDNAITKSVNFK